MFKQSQVAPILLALTGATAAPIVYELFRDKKRKRELHDWLAYASLAALGGGAGYMGGRAAENILAQAPHAAQQPQGPSYEELKQQLERQETESMLRQILLYAPATITAFTKSPYSGPLFLAAAAAEHGPGLAVSAYDKLKQLLGI